MDITLPDLPEINQKDPDDVLDFQADYSSWMVEGDAIIASEWTIEGPVTVPPLTIDSDSFTDTAATVFLAGGLEGTVYRVTNRITTADGRQKDETKAIEVVTQ